MLKVSPQTKMDQHVRKLRKAKGARERALWYPRDSQRRDKLLNSQAGEKAEILAYQFDYYRQFPTTPGYFDTQFNQANFVAGNVDALRFFATTTSSFEQASARATDREAREGEPRAYVPPPPAPTVQSNVNSIDSTRFFEREASRRRQEEEVAEDDDLQRTHRN